MLSEGFAGDDKDDSSDDDGEKIKSEAEDPQKLKGKRSFFEKISSGTNLYLFLGRLFLSLDLLCNVIYVKN